MLIGSQSKSRLIEIFYIGLRNAIRECGQPEEVWCTTTGCKLYAKSSELMRRCERMRVHFEPKEDATVDAVQAVMDASGIGGRISTDENGWYVISLPSFEWRQLPQLVPVHDMVEQFALHSLASRTWVLDVKKYIDSGFNINSVIEKMKEMDASDLHLRAGNRPYIRVDNDLDPMDLPILSAEDMKRILLELGGQSEVELLQMQKESSFQYHSAGVGYLRCSGYIKSGSMALAIRLIPEEPIPLEKLDLPPVVARITEKKRGLFLVCGITGSGKSTTLAALVDEMNKKRKLHIITTEDPVEFVYQDKKSIISQRMVGRDTDSFANALRGALREDPDVILVGEMRDQDTIRAGLSAAETGHLVMSTLHTTTAVDTVNRIISYFPQSERDLIRQELAYTLEAVVCQRLLKRVGKGRIPCVEILLGGIPIVRDAIIDGDLEKLEGIMENDSDMQTFDQHAVSMFRAGIVSMDEAVSACRDVGGFNRVMAGIKGAQGKLLSR
jgi:twitching motility protein PilT